LAVAPGGVFPDITRPFNRNSKLHIIFIKTNCRSHLAQPLVMWGFALALLVKSSQCRSFNLVEACIKDISSYPAASLLIITHTKSVKSAILLRNI